MPKTTKKILIVEDDVPIMKALSEKLSQMGYSILEARDGEAGLKFALKEKPDVILLDIIMPIMDGMTMLKKLREDEWGKDAEVMILTNLTYAGKKTEAIEEGVYDYLVKSDWKLNDLITKVREKLGRA